jgi:hypothetical protein
MYTSVASGCARFQRQRLGFDQATQDAPGLPSQCAAYAGAAPGLSTVAESYFPAQLRRFCAVAGGRSGA